MAGRGLIAVNKARNRRCFLFSEQFQWVETGSVATDSAKLLRGFFFESIKAAVGPLQGFSVAGGAVGEKVVTEKSSELPILSGGGASAWLRVYLKGAVESPMWSSVLEGDFLPWVHSTHFMQLVCPSIHTYIISSTKSIRICLGVIFSSPLHSFRQRSLPFVRPSIPTTPNILLSPSGDPR